MAAPIGNEYYRLREKDGRGKIFETPEDLYNICNDYFEWCETNPLKEEVVFHAQGVITKTTIDKKRPFTLIGLCIFLGITKKCFNNYEDREDFLHVTTCIREIIYNQKFEGATTGFFNANIIARDLGLVDKKEQSIKTEPRVFKIVKE